MTAAACPLCSRIAAGLGRPVCPLCHGAAAITLGPIATTDVMAHAVAIAIRRGVDSVLADVDADPAVNATDALEHLADGLRAEGYLAGPDDVEAVTITGERITITPGPVILDETAPVTPEDVETIRRHLDRPGGPVRHLEVISTAHHDPDPELARRARRRRRG